MSLHQRITIIGLGLIGSSIARALHEKKPRPTIIGCDASEVALSYCRKHKFIDIALSDVAQAVKEANIVILATPAHTLEDIAKTIAPHLAPSTLVMDVCSVKVPAIAAIAPHMPKNVTYIPAHPIAGSEQSGMSAGKADLFVKKRVVITPENEPTTIEIQRATEFWNMLGARLDAMPPALHDEIYAYVSHLPQLLCFAAAKTMEISHDDFMKDALLQKFLRISLSEPSLWIPLFILNKENILKGLDRYLDVVSHIQTELNSAPKEEASGNDTTLARLSLFPRIAASCLVTTVMEAEKNSAAPLARFAGTGFADFTYPASQPPEGDIEHISKQYAEVIDILEAYSILLKTFRNALREDDIEGLQKLLRPN